jgi:hypothetical protein
MGAFARDFWKSKTTWSAIVAIITALGAWASGELDWRMAVGAAFYALFQAFRRDTSAKLRDTIEELATLPVSEELDR